MAGIGVDAHIVYHVSGSLKARTGKLAYWVAGLSVLGRRLASLQVEIAGQAHACSFTLVSKVRNYGGDFEIARSVTLFDNDFEVVLFEGSNSLGYVKYLLGMALNRLIGMKGVTGGGANACEKCRGPIGRDEGPLAGRQVMAQ